nr:uncharacterized protein I303_00252 [Kwoniella dejecticola CBS 10117]OBR88435.1 hypothetical protein I303_00252 [Kwoniella dejecticola CBS 10117]
MSSSSKSKDKNKSEADVRAQRKAYLAKANPATVEELISSGELENEHPKEGQWRPSWANVEFDEDACLQNILFVPQEGFYAPAGTILPLGAQMPEMTILKYGG